MTPTRIYLTQQKDGTVRLVRAPNAAQARSHVASDIEVHVATQDELIKHRIDVETAGEAPAAEPPPPAPPPGLTSGALAGVPLGG